MDNTIDKRILFEDNHLIIVNKLPKEIVQGDKTGDHTLADSVKEYIKRKYKKPGDVFLGITHRLDRPVSGAVIFCRTSKALVRLNEMLRDKNITKTYWAITSQRPPLETGTLENYIRKDEAKNKAIVTGPKAKTTKYAILHYQLLNSSDNYNLISVRLETGRHHQIRIQLSHINCPIKGDLKYGYPRSNKDGSISLHARELSFIHPVKKEAVRVIAPVPNDELWKYFEKNI